ncbi:MAG TPA: hypothetical protein VNA89_04635 [Gemmatimonadaceae bacterium]|nr:hypothetical protein [Gemmatimonadaceae bacterium]
MRHLENASPTREALIRRFVRALERSDTAELRAMIANRAEYAYLYYPTGPNSRPPYAQQAGLSWFLLIEDSQKGVTRAVQRYGGRPLQLRGYACPGEPRHEGENTVWPPCVLRVGPGRDTVSKRLFGVILERGGRFKFLSYANDL